MFVYVLKISFYGDHVIKSGQLGLSIYRFLQFQAILFQLPKCKRKYRRQLLNIVFLQGLDTKKLCDTQLEHNLCHQHKANRELIYFSIAFHPFPNNN